MLGFAPIVVRSTTHGELSDALVVAAVTAAAVWVVPRRWARITAVAVATGSALVVLPGSLALATGVFTAGAALLTLSPSTRPTRREARAVLGVGLGLASALLVLTPLVSIPTAVLLGAIVAAAAADRWKPRRLSDSLDAAGRVGERLAARTPVALRRYRPVLDDGPSPTRARHGLLIVCAVVAAGAVAIAIRDQHRLLVDDAAITFRYAVRIASGDGFTYNDGDRTNGASAPLYTLVLAVGHLVTRDVETFARALGVACYAGVAALVTGIVGRARSLTAGAVAGFVLITSTSFRVEALSGMESALAALLGMLVILLLAEDRMTWAGVVLGLALVNKLDAGFLALAVGGGWLVVHRHPPWRLAAVAALTAAPWFAFSQLYFGSMLPFSASQKLGGAVASTATHDTGWILDSIEWDQKTGLLIAGIVVAVLVATRLIRMATGASLVLVSCALWVVLHGAAFSFIDLGDPYPWYTTVLFPPLIVAGVLALFTIAQWTAAAMASLCRSEPSRRTLTRVLTGVVVVFLVAASLWPGVDDAMRVLRHGHRVTDFERFDDTRRRAGEYVAERADPGEVVESCYGWVAFATLAHPFRESCPLSTRIDPGPPNWIVESYQPGQQRAIVPPGRRLIATFRSPDGETLVFRDET